jgi:hypothetical protein
MDTILKEDLDKYNLHPAEYYEKYFEIWKNNKDEFFKLPKTLIDVLYVYISRKKEDKIVAMLSANYTERYGKGTLYFFGSPLVK